MNNGKGSARRPGIPGAYGRGYDRIRWMYGFKSADGISVTLRKAVQRGLGSPSRATAPVIRHPAVTVPSVAIGGAAQ